MCTLMLVCMSAYVCNLGIYAYILMYATFKIINKVLLLGVFFFLENDFVEKQV